MTDLDPAAHKFLAELYERQSAVLDMLEAVVRSMQRRPGEDDEDGFTTIE